MGGGWEGGRWVRRGVEMLLFYLTHGFLAGACCRSRQGDWGSVARGTD
jgi:hypothetical protein